MELNSYFNIKELDVMDVMAEISAKFTDFHKMLPPLVAKFNLKFTKLLNIFINNIYIHFYVIVINKKSFFFQKC